MLEQLPLNVTKVEQSDGCGLSTLCPLLGYSRQAYYQQKLRREKEIFEGELLIQEVIRIRSGQNKLKRLGTRKLLIRLEGFMREHNIRIGRDALFELLREHKMLVRRRRPARPRTTFSYYWTRRFPNLIQGFVPTGPNQLWVSDITYIRIGKGFGYLSLITDAYSHKIVGFHLSRDLRAATAREPLRRSLMQPFEFSLGIWGSEMIQKAGPKRPAHNESLRRPEAIPGELLESLARFRFVSGINCKPISGLCNKRKLIGGQTI